MFPLIVSLYLPISYHNTAQSILEWTSTTLSKSSQSFVPPNPIHRIINWLSNKQANPQTILFLFTLLRTNQQRRLAKHLHKRRLSIRTHPHPHRFVQLFDPHTHALIVLSLHLAQHMHEQRAQTRSHRDIGNREIISSQERRFLQTHLDLTKQHHDIRSRFLLGLRVREKAKNRRVEEPDHALKYHFVTRWEPSLESRAVRNRISATEKWEKTTSDSPRRLVPSFPQEACRTAETRRTRLCTVESHKNNYFKTSFESLSFTSPLW